MHVLKRVCGYDILGPCTYEKSRMGIGMQRTFLKLKRIMCEYTYIGKKIMCGYQHASYILLKVKNN